MTLAQGEASYGRAVTGTAVMARSATRKKKKKVKKVRNSLTWFSHGSGAASAPVPLRRVSFST